MNFDPLTKRLISLLMFLMLVGCGEDHIEKCVQAGLKSWEINQAWYADEKRRTEAEKQRKEEESKSKPVDGSTGIRVPSPGDFGARPPRPQTLDDLGLEIDFEAFRTVERNVKSPPDTREAAEFRIRGYCLSQSKPTR